MSSPWRVSRCSGRWRSSDGFICPASPAWPCCWCMSSPWSVSTTSRRSSAPSISTATSAFSTSPPRSWRFMPAESRQSVALAITGASGALYATRTLAALLERGFHVELIVTEYGRRLLRDELGDLAAVDRLADYLADKYGEATRGGS